MKKTEPRSQESAAAKWRREYECLCHASHIVGLIWDRGNPVPGVVPLGDRIELSKRGRRVLFSVMRYLDSRVAEMEAV